MDTKFNCPHCSKETNFCTTCFKIKQYCTCLNNKNPVPLTRYWKGAIEKSVVKTISGTIVEAPEHLHWLLGKEITHRACYEINEAEYNLLKVE